MIKLQIHYTQCTFCYEEETLKVLDLYFRDWKKVHSIITIHFPIQLFPKETLGSHFSSRNIYFSEICYSRSHIFPSADSRCYSSSNHFGYPRKTIKFCWKSFDWFQLIMFVHGLNIYHEIEDPWSLCLISSDISRHYPQEISVFVHRWELWNDVHRWL